MNGARYAYLARVCELVSKGSDFVVVSDDYAAPVFDQFRIDYPQRFLSVGIAEQNLIAVSCGLALGGKRPIAYGCAPFPVTRGFDIIKSAAAMMDLPVTIVMAGIGFAVPEWGATHYNAEDIALMRTIPNMRIITPTDNIMGAVSADYSLKCSTPLYLRFDKYAEGELYKDRTIDFERGFEVLRDGAAATIITCGCFTARLLELSGTFEKSIKIIDLFGIPFNAEDLISQIGDSPIITIEEHILSGGIGSAILELYNERGLKNTIKRMGINFSGAYPQTSGSREHFFKKYNLSDEAITATVNKLIAQ